MNAQSEHPALSSRQDHAALVRLTLEHMQLQAIQGSWQRQVTGYTMERRVLACHNLIHVISGQAVWVLQDKPVELSPGDLLVVPPGLWHHAYARTRRVNIGSFHLQAVLPGGRDVFQLLGIPQLRSVDRGSRLDQLLQLAVAEYVHPGEQIGAVMHAWHRLILTAMIRADHQARRLTPTPLDPVVADLLARLDQRLTDPPTLSQLSHEAGYSPQHLNRLFKQAIGVTPLQYLTHARMQRAAQLLAEGSATVAAVGEAVGYNNPFYFSRLFRRHHGLSPAQYRRSAYSESAGNPSTRA